MISDLGEIKVTPLAGRADWEGYPAGYDRHPARNHPGFTREVVIHLGEARGSLLWDPQAGVGTTLIEGARLGYDAAGWDIDARWRALWMKLPFARELETPKPATVSVVVSSPAYFGTNKARGRGPKQEANHKSIGSVAGCEWGDLPPGHLGAAADVIEWILLTQGVLEKVMSALRPGGRLGWIVRDRIVEGRAAGFVDLNANLLERQGFLLEGGLWRHLVPTANEQMRAAGAARDLRGQGFLASPPVWPTIDREWALIARKPP